MTTEQIEKYRQLLQEETEAELAAQCVNYRVRSPEMRRMVAAYAATAKWEIDQKLTEDECNDAQSQLGL